MNATANAPPLATAGTSIRQPDFIARACWLLALVILAVPLIVRSAVLISTPMTRVGDIVDYIYDDGYYYLGVAANLADSGQSTLDGMTATNGYQPGWLLILTALAKAVGTEPHTLFVACCALVYVIALLGALLALAWWKTPSRTVALCTASGLAITMVEQPIIFLQGLETILFAPLLLGLTVLLERRETGRHWHVKVSALLACAFLVRIDALVLYVTTCLFLPLFDAHAAGRKALGSLIGQMTKLAIKLGTFVLPTVAAYMVINLRLFGLPVPVSGLAKAVGGPLFSNWGVILTYFGHLKSIVLLVAILLALEFLTRRLRRDPEPLFYRSLAIVSSAMLLHCLYYASFSTWLLWPWYQYLVAIDIALVIARILYLSSLFELRRLEAVLGIAPVLVIAALAVGKMLELTRNSLPASQLDDTMTQEQANIAMLAGDFFPKGRATLIAMGDRSGGLAYWGRDRVHLVQTEGLTMGAAYYRARAANEGTQYLERLPLQYLVVDREVIPTTAGPDGQLQFVITDPIQGRVSTTPVPTFCFPADAIRYKKSYPSWKGTSERLAFEFARRVPCSDTTLAQVRAIETGIGLRQYSLPSEYAPPDAPISKRSEDRDRHYHGRGPQEIAFARYIGGEIAR
jgi:hypothetical protein